MKANLFRTAVMAILVATAFAATPARAALQKVGAISPVHGFPVWFQDAGGLALQLCLDQNNPFCVLTPPFDPAVAPTPPGPLPITTAPGAVLSATNFPEEAFWYFASVDNTLSVAGGTDQNGNILPTSSARFVMGIFLEAAFATPDGSPGNNQQTAFIRIDMAGRAFGFVPNSTYTVTHPYGSFTFTTNASGGTDGFRNEAGCFGPPCGNFATVLPGILPVFAQQAAPVTVDKFLVWDPAVTPAAPAGFIGDPAVPHEVVFFGDPAPAQQQRIAVSGPGLPAGGQAITRFSLAGKKVGLDVAPFPATPVLRSVIGAAPTTTPITITNLTGADLALAATPITFTGTDAADYRIAATPASTCTGTLLATGAGSSCSFTLEFAPAPAAKGPRAASATVTPADINLAPAVSIALSGIAQVPITVTVGANGALQKVQTPTNVAAVTENVDAGTSVKYLPVPNDVVANVSKYLPLIKVNNLAPTLATDGTFTLASLGAPQTVDVSFVRPGDVAQPSDTVELGDALETLKIVTGVNAAPTDAQRLAADVGPLVAGKPTADGIIDISDVLVILWRVLSQPPSW